MKIKKTASKKNFIRKHYLFESARSAFKNYLISLDLKPEDKILLPAYIGWSSREGSGIFDPVRELNLARRFYKLDKQLNIDTEDIYQIILNDKTVKVLLIVHYFGYPDSNTLKITQLAKSKGIVVIEDEAHAFFTDVVSGLSGRNGHASFYSLHKILPTIYGGGLVINDSTPVVNQNSITANTIADESILPWNYDLQKIAQIRTANAALIYERLKDQDEYISFLKPLETGVCPQTIPLLIKNNKRDYLYFKLNEIGFGVVSLYHTMISQITEADYPVSHSISQQILNLPVHQDINTAVLNNFIDILISEIKT